MGKINRGNTFKLNIRLSITAKQNIEIAAKNLGISQGGVILFELTKLLKDPPTLSELNEMENEITLERKHFVVTVNKKIFDEVNEMAEDYDMNKNVLVGYMISKVFEKVTDYSQGKNTENKKIVVQVNKSLKKKMIEYSEDNYIPLNAIVSYSILEGPYEGLPSYEDDEMEKFFTNIPNYIWDLVRERSEDYNVRYHFYTSLCIYNQCMIPNGRFYE